MGSCKMSYGVVGVSAIVLMMMMAGGAGGQLAPSPSVDCETVVLTLTDCLAFVTGSAASPPANCCTELSTVITNSPQCLCLLFNTSFTTPLGVNVTRAQQLPPACKLQTPPTSLCSLLGVPVPAPVSSIAPVVAPSPAKTVGAPSPAKTPTSSKAPKSAPASTPAAATPLTAASPTGSTVPSGAAQPNTSSITPAPSGAPSITSQTAAVSASLLFASLILLLS